MANSNPHASTPQEVEDLMCREFEKNTDRWESALTADEAAALLKQAEDRRIDTSAPLTPPAWAICDRCEHGDHEHCVVPLSKGVCCCHD